MYCIKFYFCHLKEDVTDLTTKEHHAPLVLSLQDNLAILLPAWIFESYSWRYKGLGDGNGRKLILELYSLECRDLGLHSDTCEGRWRSFIITMLDALWILDVLHSGQSISPLLNWLNSLAWGSILLILNRLQKVGKCGMHTRWSHA